MANKFPKLLVKTVAHGKNHHLSYRSEKTLNKDKDIMFSYEDGK